MPNVSPEIDKLNMLRALFGEYHSNVKENRRFYNLDFVDQVVPPPAEGTRDDLWAVMATTARRAIDDPSDHILPFPRVKVPVRPTENGAVEEQKSAELRRDFLNAWWECEEAEYSVLANARKVLLNEGRVVVRKTLKWGAIPDFPGKAASVAERQKFRRAMGKLGQYDFLWRLELLDNLTVFEDPSNPRDPQYVFVEHEILAEEAKRLFPNMENPPTDDYSAVKYVEYWSRPNYKFDGTYEEGDFKQFIDDKLVKSAKSPYPYIPIIIEDSGFGMSYHLAKPHERYVGMTQYTHDIFIAESRQLTTMENVAEITGFAPVITRNMPPEKEISVSPRSVIPLDGGPDDSNRETIEYLVAPPVPVTVPQVIQLTQRMANETLKFDTLGGSAQKGIETATEADQTLRNAAAKLQGPVVALTRLVNKASRWVLIDVDEVLDTKVTVYGTAASGANGTVTIGPKDIKGFYTVQAELTTSDADAIELTKARFWMDAYRAVPFLSAMTAMEKGGVSDEPMKEMVKRSAEDVFLSELMRQARVMTGGSMFGQLNEMIMQIQQGGTAPTAPNPADNMVEQEGLTAPVTDRIRTDSLAARDLQGGQYQA